MPRWLWLLSSLIAVSFLLLAVACGDDEEGADGGDNGGGAPAVEITAPEDGSTVAAGDVEVSVDVANFNIVDKLDQDPVEGEGHVHFFLDVADIPTTAGEPAVSSEGTYHAEATISYAWPDVEPGEHTFAVQLVNNNHTPLDPPVIAQVTVTVTGGASLPGY